MNIEKVFLGLHQNQDADVIMQTVIADLAFKEPHGDWRSFGKIDFSQEIIRLQDWFFELLRRDPNARFRGLWFGIKNPIIDNQTTTDFYVYGCRRFDESDASAQWASDVNFFPVNGFARSSVLDSIYQIAYSSQDGLGNDAELPLCLVYTTLVINAVLRDHMVLKALSDKGTIGIAVGWDHSDPHYIGTVSNGCFMPKSASEMASQQTEHQALFKRRFERLPLRS